MYAKDLMSKNPCIISPESKLKDAAKEMKKLDCGFLPICEDDPLVGTITDRDIVIQGVADGKDSNSKVRDVMSNEVHYCFENDDIKDVADKMCKLQIRRLMILNDNKRITGIISLGDIATRCRDKKMSGKIIEDVSEKP